MTKHTKFWKLERGVFRILIVICAAVLVVAIATLYFQEGDISDPGYTEVPADDPDRIENGIHVRTGLIAADGLTETVTNCTSCHSADLIIQNRLDRAGWIANIRWMQETQNLWDLGDNEEIIVNYLVRNYPVVEKGRRENLKDIEWYKLKP